MRLEMSDDDQQSTPTPAAITRLPPAVGDSRHLLTHKADPEALFALGFFVGIQVLFRDMGRMNRLIQRRRRICRSRAELLLPAPVLDRRASVVMSSTKSAPTIESNIHD